MSISNITNGGTATQAPQQIAKQATVEPKSVPKQDSEAPTTQMETSHAVQSPPAPEKTPVKEVQAPTEAEMRELTQKVQTAIDKSSKDPLNVGFRPDDRSGGFIIEIRSDSGELVKQFPQEKVLNMRHKLDELSGMVIDELT